MQALRYQIENRTNKAEKFILFFDELPWLASKKSGFLPALEFFWNQYLSKRRDIIVIVCGSAANWMITNIINNKAGLHNRLTLSLSLDPFNLYETKVYLDSRGIKLNIHEILKIYMCIGGVAQYLNFVQRGESAAEFINRVMYASQAPFDEEFDRLFQSLFDNYQDHIKIIKVLGASSAGMTANLISDKTKISTGGTFSKILKELQYSGFIDFTQPFQKQKKDGLFRLIDEYCNFYLRWIEPLHGSIQDSYYWQKQIGKPRFYNWAGLAFESLCFKQLKQINARLGIAGLTTQLCSFKNEKCQIDLLIMRSDNCIHLCEVKYSDRPFILTLQEAKNILNRKEQLQNSLKKNMQIFITLITPLEAKKNKHYLGLIDQEINIQDLMSIS
jgi:hypothetical protein